MLFWRIVIALPLIGGIIVASYIDMEIANRFSLRGIVLLPIFILFIAALCDELLRLIAVGGLRPRRSTVFWGTIGMIVCCWLACLIQAYNEGVLGEHVSPQSWPWSATASVWTLLAMGGGIMIAFLGEINRYTKPGGITINLAGAVFVTTYIGMLSCFIVQLRMAYGIAALLSLIFVAKMCDTGAYTIGRIFGQHKLTPIISPGKTVEGAVGGMLFGVFGAWFWFNVVIPISFNTRWIAADSSQTAFWGCILFGLCLFFSGALGDLAASLIKRDVQQKDSSRWLPGLGGCLDIFDSILLSAPVAYAFWAFGLVG